MDRLTAFGDLMEHLMLKPEFSGQFKRDYKLAVKRGCNPKKLEEVITLLCNEQPLPERIEITLSLIPETIRI